MNAKDKINSQHIAIIGAGLAGAVFGRRMLRAGHKVTVFDKSRGTGGRHAGARLGQVSADLGAPFFDAPSKDFQTWLGGQSEIIGWQPRISDFSLNAQPNETFFSASPRQSALTRSLLDTAEIITSTRVCYLWPETEGVIVRDEQGTALGHFDSVIIATPAPQAVPLLEATPRFMQRAEMVETRPAWMTIVSLEERSGLDAALLKGEHPIFQRITLDSVKPGRNGGVYPETWCLEANTEWSLEHQDADPIWVKSQLLEAFQTLIPNPLSVANSRTHRWLFARHLSNVNETFLWSKESNIGVCGDWLHGKGEPCLGSSESAWRSANDLADHLHTLSSQQNAPAFRT